MTTLADAALQEVRDRERAEQRKLEEQREAFRHTLVRRVFEVLGRVITVDDVSDEVVVEIDGLPFTLLPRETIMDAPLGYMQACTECGQMLVVRVGEFYELGLILRAAQDQRFLCEPCQAKRVAEQELLDALDESPREAETAIEKVLVALQAAVIDYSIGGRNILDDFRQWMKKGTTDDEDSVS